MKIGGPLVYQHIFLSSFLNPLRIRWTLHLSKSQQKEKEVTPWPMGLSRPEPDLDQILCGAAATLQDDAGAGDQHDGPQPSRRLLGRPPCHLERPRSCCRSQRRVGPQRPENGGKVDDGAAG
jgi:hypothetical protein